jgi:hypothetical protein
MNLSKSILGKEIEELELNDIINYFQSPKEESDVIEYKSFYEKNQDNFKHKENAVLKTICGFLNSKGGLLIWGAPKENKNSDINIYEGELSPVQKEIDRDNFINKVVQKIQPVPSNIKFFKIKITDNEFVYIIEVAESFYKPHQFDSRFWMRNDGQTNVAPYHYVEALFKRISYPNLSATIRITQKEILIHNEKYRLRYSVILKNLSFYQNETNPILSVHIDGVHNKAIPNKSVLHYGNPIELIGSFESYSLQNRNFELMIKFGGDKSPMKFTKKIVKCELWSIIDTPQEKLRIEIKEESVFQNKHASELE